MISKKITTKLSFLAIALILIMAIAPGCGFVSTEDFDPSTLPPQWSMDITGSGATSFVSFTGSPAADFAGEGVVLNDAEGDVSPATGDITKVYIAYSQYYLFIGHESPDSVQDPDANGAFYVLIDNGITNGDGSNGLFDISNDGLLADPDLTGDFGSFDGLGVTVDTTGGNSARKVSLYYKHWRPLGADMKAFRFTMETGPMEAMYGASFMRYPSSSSSSTPVTEVAIPWAKIFGEYTNQAVPPGKIYLWFGTDPTMNRPGPQDTAPDNPAWDTVSVWHELTISTN